jgi:hypothetical protein
MQEDSAIDVQDDVSTQPEITAEENTSQDVEDSPSSTDESQSDKIFTQAEVDNITAAVRKKYSAKAQQHDSSYDDGQKNGDQYADYDQPVVSDQQIQKPYQVEQGNGDLDSIIEQRVQDSLINIIQQAQQEQEISRANEKANETASQIIHKMDKAADKYGDFKEVINGVDSFRETPAILHYANMADNGGDVAYHLAKNPMQIGNLLSLPENLARQAIQKLSSEIKAKEATAQAPVSVPDEQLRPSPVGAADGKMTSTDYSKIYTV